MMCLIKKTKDWLEKLRETRKLAKQEERMQKIKYQDMYMTHLSFMADAGYSDEEVENYRRAWIRRESWFHRWIW